MELITPELIKILPRLSSTEREKKKKLMVKLFTPWVYQVWYLAEYDPIERLGYGYIRGHEDEWGHFSLAKLEKIRGPGDLKIERDLYFKPVEFAKIGR